MSTEVVGVLVAAVGIVVGWLLGRRSERIARGQLRLDAMSFAGGWYSDLRSWASEAIEVLTEAAYLDQGICDSSDASRSHTAAKCRCRLSALIDRGRFFLPNNQHENVGINKPAAYRGVRHRALDYLVAAEQILGGTLALEDTPFQTRTKALVALKREFVSTIHVVLDPRSHIRRVNELLDASRSGAPDKTSPIGELVAAHAPSAELLRQ